MRTETATSHLEDVGPAAPDAVGWHRFVAAPGLCGVDRFGASVAGRFSPWSRSVVTLGILAISIICTYGYSAIHTGPLIDERTWVDRSLQPLWQPGLPSNYYYAIHHPSFARIVYGSVMHAMSVYKVDAPLVDYSKDSQWYIRNGALPPADVELALRLVNVAFLSAAVALAYFALKRIFRNRALAVAGCLPLIFNYPIGSQIGACPYIGADCMLVFWLVAFWFVWLTWGDRGAWGVLGLAAVGGLLVSTKLNGLFALAAAWVYFAVTARGARRVLWPLALMVVPAAVFVALNPVCRAGDVAWTVEVLRNVGRLMLELKAKTAGDEWAQFTRVEVLREAFPYWLLIVPAFAVIAGARRERWFCVTAVWAAATVVPNALLIYVPILRYSAPISAAFLILFGAAGLKVIADAWREAVGGDAPAAEDAATETPVATEAAR